MVVFLTFVRATSVRNLWLSVRVRGTREGWPLITVGTEVNGDPKNTNGRGPSLVACWACSASTRKLCSALAALLGPVQNNFYLTVHYFNSFVPNAQQAGQAAVLGYLSLRMCLWLQS